MTDSKRIFFVMGVSGTGKTTVGKLLAQTLSISFFDGDDYHPKENIEKMASGVPLNDDDRAGWLKSLNDLAKEQVSNGCVIACSALKKKYRDILSEGIGQFVRFVYLKGSISEIRERLENRKGHFMPKTLLQSQFDALEPPEGGITALISASPEEIVRQVLEKIKS
ncbi:gluconokinase [Allomuricauda sp. SCSIO 65647]|uniref:gluconokinase n=1 Tax=Allomuricauda sp. SCSIO 65647 TaxID=2908843 RepID=UPI001F2336CB|nr:gluconokinase [Muricauda sp. SCSIO 65647]UJH67593.1 gluconokinase [Muricauda sp. SCSIO 65647]